MSLRLLALPFMVAHYAVYGLVSWLALAGITEWLLEQAGHAWGGWMYLPLAAVALVWTVGTAVLFPGVVNVGLLAKCLFFVCFPVWTMVEHPDGAHGLNAVGTVFVAGLGWPAATWFMRKLSAVTTFGSPGRAAASAPLGPGRRDHRPDRHPRHLPLTAAYQPSFGSG